MKLSGGLSRLNVNAIISGGAIISVIANHCSIHIIFFVTIISDLVIISFLAVESVIIIISDIAFTRFALTNSLFAP